MLRRRRAMLRRRRSANRTQPHFAKRRMVNRANNLLQNSWGRPSGKKWEPRNFYICSVFRRLRHLMANIFCTKRDIDNRQRRLKVRRVSYIVQKFRELWSINGLKRDRNFYPPSLFCFLS